MTCHCFVDSVCGSFVRYFPGFSLTRGQAIGYKKQQQGLEVSEAVFRRNLCSQHQELRFWINYLSRAAEGGGISAKELFAGLDRPNVVKDRNAAWAFYLQFLISIRTSSKEDYYVSKNDFHIFSHSVAGPGVNENS